VLVREEAAWLREHGLAPRYFCGGGWYLDAELAETLAELGYVDCTATTFRQSYLADEAPRLQLEAPTRLRLPSGAELLELPATHSVGMLARGQHRLPALVHLHFHDWELLDRRRAAAIGGSESWASAHSACASWTSCGSRRRWRGLMGGTLRRTATMSE